MTYPLLENLFTLDILSIRNSLLKELPVEIGKLTNLIMLEIWLGYIILERISPGGLLILVQLEELHMMEVQHCSYSILRDLDSLTRLTALTLIKYSGDVVYSNLGLSSKLKRHTLKVSQWGFSFIQDFAHA